MTKKSTTLKKASKDKAKTFKEFWRARVMLRIHGFISDSENAKIIKRLEAYRVKNNIVITNKELVS